MFLTDDLSDKFKQLWGIVGSILMLELCYEYKGKSGSLYVKCEYYNLTAVSNIGGIVCTAYNINSTGEVYFNSSLNIREFMPASAKKKL